MTELSPDRSIYSFNRPIISFARGVLLSLFLSVVMAGCTERVSPVTIIHNVNGYTLVSPAMAPDQGGEVEEQDGVVTKQGEELPDPSVSWLRFEAMAISEGKVLKTGSGDKLIGLWPDARRVDAGGKTLLPGLIDAHAHVLGLGEAKLNVNLMGLQSLDETLDSIASYAVRYPELTWIRGRGWNQVLWPENRFPTAVELDKAVSGRPVWMRRVDGHAGWANSEAMRIAGIDRDTPDPDGGLILRDEHGEPTGVFIDRAMYLVSRHIPAPSQEERELALETSLREMRSEGLTGVHDAGISAADLLLMQKFADRDKLTVRIYAMIRGTGDDFDRITDRQDLPGLPGKGPLVGYADDRLHVRSVKIFADGALGSRGAAMIEDYSDEPGNRGLLLITEEELARQITKAASKGYQVGVHAIGDKGNRVVLNAFEQANLLLSESEDDPSPGQSDRDLRHRIEHAQIIHPDDMGRFRDLGIIASVQPVHAVSDMNMAEDRVGPVRISGAYAWRTLMEQGAMLAAGSDFPVELANPFHGLHAAITRQDAEGRPQDGWYPRERLSREQALFAFTMGAAYAGHMEQTTGSLEPGKWADFILIDRDYFEIPAQEIRDITVLETWLAGRQVYQR